MVEGTQVSGYPAIAQKNEMNQVVLIIIFQCVHKILILLRFPWTYRTDGDTKIAPVKNGRCVGIDYAHIQNVKGIGFAKPQGKIR